MNDRHYPDVDSQFPWSPWQPLQQCWKANLVLSQPGLYRIRRIGRDDVDYIGQTGQHLWQRLAMLRGVYQDEMPYRDPHTAAPALWALFQRSACDFEVSTVPVPGSTAIRKGWECVAIAQYRQIRGRSPTVNFGRMPDGYSMSSGNNKKLARSGARFRGGPTNVPEASHIPGIAPAGVLAGDPQAVRWCGHAWWPWVTLPDGGGRLPGHLCGLYRIRALGRPGLVYIGEGQLRKRLQSHRRKIDNPAKPQGQVLGTADDLECSWVPNEAWLDHHRLELETDLIAAHVLCLRHPPLAQFIG